MRISDWSSDVCSSDLVNPLQVGALTLQPLFTPGHTDAHHSYLLERPGALRIFTGDALLIDGCGRTDFQNGDAPALYGSVHEKLFSLPGDALVYPAHDYEHRSEAHTSELQSLLRITYQVFC